MCTHSARAIAEGLWFVLDRDRDLNHTAQVPRDVPTSMRCLMLGEMRNVCSETPWGQAVSPHPRPSNYYRYATGTKDGHQ